ncbi:efflux RND transporter permease subunit [Burkholderia ubonensis]|uniref:AcrB/AcrD/AcrF family protein n=1 Tax=Burkholderia ubonensis TaxID=101571 RepID=A0AB74DDY4_9BURK|nr:efflux RND transporter permease subunit [Burkholderia ubonensis]PAJ77493.1 acriflavin resistance protein [Burkholderia ubonensis]PAJ86920.1 acriflavin resistance protein [Burkholderia ubonensis]PAJ93811.1 acriflavin resistance protein [Burkholderia ubonensis]PAJ97542.1 acriflavin resistance protein [Burkholderia ubonensis]PAK07878.1 acriflavin resistance protein [Burkholderia ubonensis]
MFRWIIGSSLQFRFLVLGIAAALVMLGATRLARMPVDVFPEFAPPIVEVQTEASGLSAEEVESLITLNLEELLSGVPWLESIRSNSVTGLSSIVLTFKRGTNLMEARQMIQERLTLAYTLPNVASPPVILQPLSVTSRFMMIGVSSDKIDPTELSLLARWTIKPRLMGVPGVANVAIWGQRLRQLHVQIDPNRLHDARVMQEDIIAAAGDALWVSPLTFLKGSAPGTGGWIDNFNQRLGVQHSMPIETPEDMAKVAVTPLHLLLTGKTMALGDVAEVTFAHPPLIGDAVVKNGNGLMLVIEKFPSANTLEVTRGVDRALAELSRGLPGVQIDNNVFRLASYVQDSVSNLTQAMLIGGVLMILVIGACLFDWRGALVSAVSIPLALSAALIALEATGATINTMILAGLLVALSVVIDDAVVDVERLRVRLRSRGESAEQASILDIIFDTTLDTRRVALYTTLIVILAVTPVFFMGGVSGAFFAPLALSYVFAVLASMLVALIVTPALCLLLYGKTPRALREPPLAVFLRGRYEAVLRAACVQRRRVLAAAGVLMAIGIGTWPLLGQSLLPPLKERELVVNWATPPGTSHEESFRITSRACRELRALPGVRYAGAHVGRAVTGDQVVEINASQIWISLDPAADYEKTVAAIRETVDGYPGIDHTVQTYVRDKVGEVLTGESKAIVVRLYGPKREILQQKAVEVRQALSDIRGLVDLHAQGQAVEPQVQVKVNLDAAGQASVKPGDVRRSSSTVFSGLVVGYLFKDQKIFEVVVWGAPETRQSLTNLQELWVEKSDRHHARLGDVADVSIVPVPTVIRHERIAPYVDVVANVSGRDAGSVTREVDARLKKIAFPLEYHPEVLGEYAERSAAQRRMLGVAAAAMIGIFLLLQACFRSWRLAWVAWLALPASLVGGVLATALAGGVISLGSIVGFLAVLGIAARNAVMLIKHYQHLEAQPEQPSGLDLVARGAREQLLPILASSAAIIAALLPMVLFGAVPGLEIAQPMAIVVIGGLLASTLITLFVMPVLYLLAGRGHAGERSGSGTTDA